MRPRIQSVSVIIALMLSSFAMAATEFRMPKLPGKTVQDDLARARVTLGSEYLSVHPRLAISDSDLDGLKQKAAEHPDLWKDVTNQGDRLKKNLPTADQVKNDYKYWRAEWMLSGALAYKVTGKQKYLADTLEWMKLYCSVDIWGVSYNSNHDLGASWNLYYISMAYDLLYNDLSDADRKTIAASLAAHAEAIYQAKSAYKIFTFDQNHMYIPITALTAGALALADDYPEESAKWLKFSAVIMNRCRYVLGNDGYYYEGTGYWLYAMHWHVRYAEMMTRACGGEIDFFDIPTIKANNLYARHMYLSDSPYSYDLGDSGKGPIQRATARRGAWAAMLYSMGERTDQPDFATVADRLRAEGANDDPAMSFLWYWQPEKARQTKFWDAKPYHYFEDHGVVCWRSSWDDDAVCYMFKAGPPQGHAAAKKLRQLKDWKMNSGHVHPDIGMFWIFANGKPLSMDSGYLAKKHTNDHSTLLVDDKGMGGDGSYWAYRGKPYSSYDNVRIIACELKDGYGYVAADMGSAWETGETGKLKMIRHVVMTEEYIMVVDELSSEKPHSWSFLVNTESDEYTTEQSMTGWGYFIQSATPESCLRVYPISPGGDSREITYGPNNVLYGRGPVEGTPTDTGGQIQIKTKPMDKCRFVVLMVPGTPMDVPPQTKLLRNDANAVEMKFNFNRIGINLKDNKPFFSPPRD